MRKSVILLLCLFSLAALSSAQIPSGSIYAGYSYFNSDLGAGTRQSLNGWEGSVEGKFFPFIGIVADFSANYGSMQFVVPCPPGLACPLASANTHLDNFLIGPRVSIPAGKFRPFAELMVGAAHVSTNGFGSDNSFSYAFGGGIDYRIVRPISWRIEGDYIHTDLFSQRQDSVRLTTGIVLSF